MVSDMDMLSVTAAVFSRPTPDRQTMMSSVGAIYPHIE